MNKAQAQREYRARCVAEDEPVEMTYDEWRKADPGMTTRQRNATTVTKPCEHGCGRTVRVKATSLHYSYAKGKGCGVCRYCAQAGHSVRVEDDEELGPPAPDTRRECHTPGCHNLTTNYWCDECWEARKPSETGGHQFADFTGVLAAPGRMT